MEKLPIIGIFSASHQLNYLLPLCGTTTHYLEAVTKTGGVPMLIPVLPDMPEEVLQKMIRFCDAFLLPGGGDFDPDWYGEELLPNLEPDPMAIDRKSQETGMQLIRMAVNSGKPVLGICLGLQVINVAMGGSLYQDIATQIPSEVHHRNKAASIEDRWKIAHTVRTEAGSLLRKITGQETLEVNSFHHQAVKTVAPGLRVTAKAPDGLIEALESENGKILGVQWHPENLSHAGDSQGDAMFRWLISAAMKSE